MSFYFPLAFLFLLFLPVIYWRNKLKNPSLSFGDTSLFLDLKPTFRIKYYFLCTKGLKIIALIFLITALARPRTEKTSVWHNTEGIDIMLTIDVSSSMKAMDFKLRNKRYNRLEVVKNVVTNFIEKRENDRLGIVIFAGETMMLCPLTTDYGVLSEFLERARIGVLKDQTAIGDALAFSVNRLRKSEAKSKVIILLTDGANNAGKIKPSIGAALANTYGIKIYAVGAGKKGKVPYPIQTPFGDRYAYIETPIDEVVLKEIASKTGGAFFRATNTDELREIYNEIDKMEKTKMEISRMVYYNEKFHLFLIPGLMILLLEIVLANTFFLKVP